MSREIRRSGWYSPVAGRMWCYRASTAHDKSQRRARRCRRQPLLADPRRLELVARLIRESAPAPPGADRGPHHDPGAPTRGRAAQPSFRAVHSGLLDHTLGGHKKMSARLRHRRRRRKGRLDGRGRITITHELGERPAIADRRERVGDWEGDTVAGRMSGAVLVTLVDRATRYLVGAQGPLQTRGGRLTAQSSRPWPPTPPPPHRGPGPRVRPRPRPPKTTGRPPLLLPGPLPLAARHRREHQRPVARGAPPPGPHWTASTPRGSNRCTINSTNDHANASTGNPPRGSPHTPHVARPMKNQKRYNASKVR